MFLNNIFGNVQSNPKPCKSILPITFRPVKPFKYFFMFIFDATSQNSLTDKMKEHSCKSSAKNKRGCKLQPLPLEIK